MPGACPHYNVHREGPLLTDLQVRCALQHLYEKQVQLEVKAQRGNEGDPDDRAKGEGEGEGEAGAEGGEEQGERQEGGLQGHVTSEFHGLANVGGRLSLFGRVVDMDGVDILDILSKSLGLCQDYEPMLAQKYVPRWPYVGMLPSGWSHVWMCCKCVCACACPFSRKSCFCGKRPENKNAKNFGCLICVCGWGGWGGGGVGWRNRAPGPHRNTARQSMDGLWTEVCGQQKQSNDPGNNQHILNTPITGRR